MMKFLFKLVGFEIKSAGGHSELVSESHNTSAPPRIPRCVWDEEGCAHSLFCKLRALLSLSCLTIASLFLLTSCTTTTTDKASGALGKINGFEKILVKGGDFWITTYQKVTNKQEPFVFYIEGDGAAFAGKYKVSDNPTPRQQMLVKLVAMDKRPNVVYVARPCQYTPMDLNPKCNISYWTDKRLSDDSVSALNEVINKTNSDGKKFSLVGYSGGGGMAVLIAARNPRVKDIITLAGNLDHKAFTSHHNVTPMIGSLNPIDYVSKINQIPQLHVSGGKDKIVPPFIANKFVAAAASPCVKQQILPEGTHKEGWRQVWEYIYTTPIRCY